MQTTSVLVVFIFVAILSLLYLGLLVYRIERAKRECESYLHAYDEEVEKSGLTTKAEFYIDEAAKDVHNLSLYADRASVMYVVFLLCLSVSVYLALP